MIDIIMFCFNDRWQDWQAWGFPTRSPILAKNLFESVQVRYMLIINAPTSYAMGLYRHMSGLRQTGSKVLSAHRGQAYLTEQIGKIFTIDQLRWLPREGSSPIPYKLNCAMHDKGLIGYIRDKIDELSMENIVLWLNNPLAARFIGKFGEKLCVYNAVDDWPLHPKLSPMRTLLERNIYVIQDRADAVFAVSSRLVDKLSGGKARAFLIPNGVDFEGYERVGVSEPEDLSDIQCPRVGYVGNMQERFDVDLFEKVIKQTPDISYVFVGPVFSHKHFESLERYTNVHFIGTRDKQDIPLYIKGFDVCVMPHKIDDFTKAMNPIKLYEYLAAGKPTIITPIPGLDSFQGVVEVADDADMFIRKIRNALHNKNEDQNLARISFAKANTWSNRVNEITGIINGLMH